MINPFSVKKIKEIDDNSPKKTGSKDPKTIAKLQKYIEQSRASSCVDILIRVKTLLQEHKQHPTMDKQNEEI